MAKYVPDTLPETIVELPSWKSDEVADWLGHEAKPVEVAAMTIPFKFCVIHELDKLLVLKMSGMTFCV